MSRTVLMHALLAAALVITAPATAAAGADVTTPEGTVWHLVSYAVDGERIQVPWNVDATLSLEGEQASGSAGCNGFLATYAIDGEALTVGDPGTTDVGCPDAWMDVEAGYMTALPATARWAIDTGPAAERGLYLYDAAGDIILEFQEPSAGLTPADIGALTSLLDAQHEGIEALRSRIKELERQVERLTDTQDSVGLSPPVSRSPGRSDPPVDGIDWGPLAVIDDPAEGGLDAAGGAGRLVVRDRCVLLRDDDGPRRTLIWRSGQTRWDPLLRQIVFQDRDLGEIRLSHGHRIRLGGAPDEPWGDSDEGPPHLAWLAEPDAACPPARWIVHQITFVEEMAPKRLKRSASVERDGVRVTVRLQRNPMIAGEPNWVRTKVTNLRDEPIGWPGAPTCGHSVYVGGRMTEATWRPFERVEEPPREPSGGFVRPVTDLRWRIQDAWVDWWPAIWLGFDHPRRVNGCGDMYFETRILPGGTVVQRVRWDGQANGAFGPPPSGPARITGRFGYRTPGQEHGRSVRVSLDSWVVEGRDPDWLHPMEAVDAALADPRLQALMEQVSLGYDSDSYVAFEPVREAWVVGACGRFDGERVHWRAAIVDPVSGAVSEIIDRPGGTTCEQGPFVGESDERT